MGGVAVAERNPFPRVDSGKKTVSCDAKTQYCGGLAESDTIQIDEAPLKIEKNHLIPKINLK